MRKTTKETKSKQINFLVRPSLIKNAYKIVHMKNESLNNLINVLLEQYVEENQKYIQKYDEVIEEG